MEQRHSKQRDAIYAMLCSTKSHPDAEWVYARLKESMPGLSLATVYRNMRLFVAEGRAIIVGTVNGKDRFDGNALPHTHFICDNCGTVTDTDNPVGLTELCTSVERQSGADIDMVVLKGVCARCKERG